MAIENWQASFVHPLRGEAEVDEIVVFEEFCDVDMDFSR